MKGELSNKPKHVKVQSDDFPTAASWFYEEPKGLELIIEISEGKPYKRYVHISISWRTLLASVSRYIGRKVTS
jgi:hypothetical protein